MEVDTHMTLGAIEAFCDRVYLVFGQGGSVTVSSTIIASSEHMTLVIIREINLNTDRFYCYART